MIKMRLHGLLDELNVLLEDLKKHYEILEVSAPYKDRGESKLYRIYVTVKSL